MSEEEIIYNDSCDEVNCESAAEKNQLILRDAAENPLCIVESLEILTPFLF